jgi:hypothetical protein
MPFPPVQLNCRGHGCLPTMALWSIYFILAAELLS